MSESGAGPILDWPAPRSLGGFSLGIICIDSHYPIIAGNVQHAATYRFPVLYGIVRGVRIEALLAGDPALEQPIIEAGRELIRQGARAIVGACGSFANYQRAALSAFGVPTCMSVLTQIPFLLSVLPADRSLGVYFASKASFTERVRRECAITDEHVQRLVMAEALSLPAFRAFAASPSRLDVAGLSAELCDGVRAMLRENPSVGAILLQCSDLPPFAHAIQRACGLPVFDVTLVAGMLQAAAARRTYRDLD